MAFKVQGLHVDDTALLSCCRSALEGRIWRGEGSSYASNYILEGINLCIGARRCRLRFCGCCACVCVCVCVCVGVGVGVGVRVCVCV